MAGRVQLATTGLQDKFFTLDPEYSYFVKNFKKHTSYATDFVSLDIINGSCTIPQNVGDLIKTISLEVEMGPGYLTESIGHVIIDYVDLKIGGKVIQRLSRDFIHIYSEHYVTQSKQKALEKLIGKYPLRSSATPVTGIQGYLGTTTTATQWFIDLPFYFYRNPTLALPLCAIDKQEIEIDVFLNTPPDQNVEPFAQAAQINKVSLNLEMVYLQGEERKRFDGDYVITQIQRNIFTIPEGNLVPTVIPAYNVFIPGSGTEPFTSTASNTVTTVTTQNIPSEIISQTSSTISVDEPAIVSIQNINILTYSSNFRLSDDLTKVFDYNNNNLYSTYDLSVLYSPNGLYEPSIGQSSPNLKYIHTFGPNGDFIFDVDQQIYLPVFNTTNNSSVDNNGNIFVLDPNRTTFTIYSLVNNVWVLIKTLTADRLFMSVSEISTGQYKESKTTPGTLDTTIQFYPPFYNVGVQGSTIIVNYFSASPTLYTIPYDTQTIIIRSISETGTYLVYADYSGFPPIYKLFDIVNQVSYTIGQDGNYYYVTDAGFIYGENDQTHILEMYIYNTISHAITLQPVPYYQTGSGETSSSSTVITKTQDLVTTTTTTVEQITANFITTTTTTISITQQTPDRFITTTTTIVVTKTARTPVLTTNTETTVGVVSAYSYSNESIPPPVTTSSTSIVTTSTQINSTIEIDFITLPDDQHTYYFSDDMTKFLYFTDVVLYASKSNAILMSLNNFPQGYIPYDASTHFTYFMCTLSNTYKTFDVENYVFLPDFIDASSTEVVVSNSGHIFTSTGIDVFEYIVVNNAWELLNTYTTVNGGALEVATGYYRPIGSFIDTSVYYPKPFYLTGITASLVGNYALPLDFSDAIAVSETGKYMVYNTASPRFFNVLTQTSYNLPTGISYFNVNDKGYVYGKPNNYTLNMFRFTGNAIVSELIPFYESIIVAPGTTVTVPAQYIYKPDYNAFKLELINPVKELYFVFQRANVTTPLDYDSDYLFFANKLVLFENLEKLGLVLDNETVIDPNIANAPYLKAVQGGIHHARTQLFRRFYSYSFACEPEKHYPTGQRNFSLAKEQLLQVITIPENITRELRVYALSFNILRITKGVAFTLFDGGQNY